MTATEAIENIRGDLYLYGIGETEFSKCYASVVESLRVIEDEIADRANVEA